MRAKRANPYHYAPIVSQQKIYKLPLKLRSTIPKEETPFSPTLAICTITGVAIILYSISAIEGIWKWAGIWIGLILISPIIIKSLFAK